jgi:hypothetical protein
MNPPDQPTFSTTAGKEGTLAPMSSYKPTLAPTPRTDAARNRYDDLSGNPCNSFDFVEPEDMATLERELAAAQSERDLAITRVASILWSGAIDKHTCGDVQKWAADYTAENTRLRAELASKTACYDIACGEVQRLRAEVERLKGMRTAAEAIMTDVAEANEEIAIARAEKAEAERDALAKDKARLDWLEENWTRWPIARQADTIRAAIDALKGTPTL